MKKKMLRNGILLAAVLVLLVVGIRAIYRQESPEETGPQSISLYTGEKAAVQKMLIQNTLSTFTLVKEGDGFSMEEAPDVPVYQTKAGNLAYTVSSVYAQSVADEAPENLVPYGLASPTATVTVTRTDGETTVFYLGNDLPIGNEAYFMMEGDPAVYTVSTVTWGDVRLNKNAYYDMTLPEFPESDRVTGLKVINGDQTVALERMPSGDGGASAWRMTAPLDIMADQSAVENDILATLRRLRALNVFSSGEEPEEMTIGRLTVEAETDSGSYTYSFGDATQEGTYMTVSGSALTYLISTGAIDPLRDEPFRYMSKTLLSPYIDEVESVTVTVEGETHILTVGAAFLLDELPIREEKARGIYESVIALTANGVKKEAAPSPDGQNEIVFSMKDGTTESLSFAETDERSMAVYQNEECRFTVSKNDLSAIMQKIKKEVSQ